MALFTVNDLTDAETFALVYVQMLCAKTEAGRRAHEAKWKQGMEHMDRERRSAHERRQMLATGLARLRERGIIECTRDGEGDLVPTVYHEEKIAPTTSRIVTGDMN
jgi:hypothetical protein